MSQTLKETYEAKRVAKMKSRVDSTNKKLLSEKNKRVKTLIMEAFDKDTATKAIDLIKRLNAIKWPTPQGQVDPFGLFRNAIKSAIAELQQALAGEGRQTNIFDKIINLFKSEKDNPFTDVIAYANALNSFFLTMKEFVNSMGGNDTDTIAKIVTGKYVKTGDKSTDASFNTLYKIIQNGLSPKGNAATLLGTTWMKKYLKGLDVKKLTADVSKITKKQLNDVAANVTQQLDNIDDIANRTAAAEQAAEQGKEPTTTVDTTLSTKANQQTPSTPGEGTAPTKRPEIQPGRQQTGTPLARRIYTNIEADLKGVADEKTVMNVLGVLADNGHLKG